MEWKAIERPGYFGKKRDELFRGFNEKFAEGKWRIVWKWGNYFTDFVNACKIYEDGYLLDSFNREGLWKDLIKTARNVWDMEESDTESGLDYSAQKGKATHLQDIAIRNVVFRRGWEFEGDKLIQIRSHADYWGKQLSPGRVEFHMPGKIEMPHIPGWYDEKSIEAFWQDNKFLHALVE